CCPRTGSRASLRSSRPPARASSASRRRMDWPRACSWACSSITAYCRIPNSTISSGSSNWRPDPEAEMLERSRIPKPKNQAHHKPAPMPEPRKNADSRGRETILLVDDERPVREFMARTLFKEGYRVLVAEDGE